VNKKKARALINRAMDKIHKQYKSGLATRDGAAITTDNPSVIATDDYSVFSRSNFLHKAVHRHESLIETATSSVKILYASKQAFFKELKEMYPGIRMAAVDSTNIECESDEVHISFSQSHHSHPNITWYSAIGACPVKMDKLRDLVKKHSDLDRVLTINWIHSSDGRYITSSERFEETVSAVLYPQIENFDTFAKRFWESKSNILILQGDPGTGKTTLIKSLLEYSGKEAYVTYDSKILDTDSPFATFMDDSESGAFVIEDADLLLDSREQGNNMISRFLNVGDGLISMRDKKLIFSTNLKNINDIDPALTREGRCFDIINFRLLTPDEALAIAN